MSFRCGHPRTPENSERSGDGYHQCKFCKRVAAVVKRVERDQLRINRGERIFGAVGQ